MDEKEAQIRAVAATILLGTVRRTGVSIRKIVKYAKRAGLDVETLLKYVEERFQLVGVALKRVKISDSDELLFAIIDEKVPIDSSAVDSTSAAILALIYIRAGKKPVGFNIILELLEEILGSRDLAEKLIMKSIRILESEGLIKYSADQRVITLTPLALALMPDKELLESLILQLLGDNVLEEYGE